MDIFADEEQQTEQPVVETEPVAEEVKPEPVRDEKGRFAPKGEEEGASPAPVEEPPFDHAAVIGERKRRQEAESRLAALEAELQKLRTPQEQPAPPPSVWEDEQGAFQHIQSQTLEQANRLSRINASEMAARIKYDDFDAMFDKFNQMAAQNPAIVGQTLDTTGTPSWLKAYEIAKNAARMEELGATNLAEAEAKLRAQIEAEYAAKAQQAAPALPTSLADGPSSRGGSAPMGVQPFTLEDIIGR